MRKIYDPQRGETEKEKEENIWSGTGWQKLAPFQRMQKWSQNSCQAHICYFRDKFVIFARNGKFANLIQYSMQ